MTPVIIGNNVYVMVPMAGEDAASFRELAASSAEAGAAFDEPLEIDAADVHVEDAGADAEATYEEPDGK